MSQNNCYQPLSLISLLTTDLAGITRGRAFPAHSLDSFIRRGCGWVPANSSLTPQDLIPDENPWGSHGDLRLMPDIESRVTINHMPDPKAPIFDFIHSNIIETNGSPWSCCPRTLLNNEIEKYREQLGIKVYGAFEHEFTFETLNKLHSVRAFSLQAQRTVGDFANWLLDALIQAESEPEMFLPEYGENQYEVTCKPTYGVTVADRAINIREIVREIARQYSLNVSFSPKDSPESVSSGVHLHVSLQDLDGNPILYDASNTDNNLSELGQYWAAGVLRYLPALCALTAPTPVSYQRLQPHHWTSAYACLGFRNREAALRICPVTTFNGSPAKQYNLEFRPMDATANPYLAMAGILIAGRLGIEQKLPLSACLDVDPEQVSPSELDKLGIRRLPATLREALNMFKAENELMAEFPPALLETYFGMKEFELQLTQNMNNEQICQQYRAIY